MHFHQTCSIVLFRHSLSAQLARLVFDVHHADFTMVSTEPRLFARHLKVGSLMAFLARRRHGNKIQ